MLDSSLKKTLSRLNIVPYEFFGIQAAYLRVAYNERVASLKCALPSSRIILCRQVSSYRAHRRK